jgi:hypothetical protein
MSEKDQEIRCEGSSSVQEIIEMSGIETTHWDRSKDDSDKKSDERTTISDRRVIERQDHNMR